MPTRTRSSSRRDAVNTGRSKMYAKRDAKGQFREMDVVGRASAADRRQPAKRTVKSGHGDQGDRRRS